MGLADVFKVANLLRSYKAMNWQSKYRSLDDRLQDSPLKVIKRLLGDIK